MSTNRLWFLVGRGSNLATPVVVTIVAALLALVLNDAQSIQFSLWVIYALLTLSLFLVWGHAGMLSLAQSAFFGVAGYAYGIIAINLINVTGESMTALLGAIVIAAAFAASLGYFMFYGRVSELYLAIITLVVTLVLYTFFASTADPKYAIGDARLGGYNGMTGVPDLTLGIPGLFRFPLSVRGTYVFVVLVTGAVYTFLRILLQSPFGRILASVRENELRTELLGYDVRWLKLIAFVLGGAIAGLAGAAYAGWGRFMNPINFSLGFAASVVIWMLVGGRSTMLGAVLGVIVVQSVTQWLGGVTKHTPIFLGILLVLVVLLFPDGLVPGIKRAWQWFKSRGGVVGYWLGKVLPQPVPSRIKETKVVQDFLVYEKREEFFALEVRDLGINFGGVQALAGVTLKFLSGVYCLIGPNGAGKSTLFNLITGRFRPTTGAVLCNNESVNRLKTHQRARWGIGLKMQIPCIYAGLSVKENVWLGAYSHLRDESQATARSYEILHQVGLPQTRFDELAGHLSHGEQQLLEIAIVLAANPKLMLLDEPSAGMTRAEALHLVELVTGLARSATVIVVEHDMEFVRKLQTPVVVLHQGKVFAQGSLDQLRQDQRVIDIYLGRYAHAES